MQTILFTINNQTYAIHLSARYTRSGFAHDSYLLKQSSENNALFYFGIGKKQSSFYINRTWEAYTYQSVIRKLIHANFDESTANAIMLDIDNRRYS
jgi:hypothetical protein